MTARCIALLSGGLDSMLAIRIMQEQGVEVEALNFKTIFTCCQDQSAQAARDLGVRLTVVGQEDDYLDLVRNPRFGYGKGANPCVDCRIYMFEKAKQFLEHVDAQFIVSGEVIGQRPMSQKRRDLNRISHHSGLNDLLLRPLSAKLLPPTLPEREGWVDREKLHQFYGRSRKGLIRLAKQYGLPNIPAPSTGCALTEVQFSRKVHDLILVQPDTTRWDFELLKVGRHFRFDRTTKVILGRREAENAQLTYMHHQPDASSTALLEPHDFVGPVALVCGPPTDDCLDFAAALMRRYGKTDEQQETQVLVTGRDGNQATRAAHSSELADSARTLASA